MRFSHALEQVLRRTPGFAGMFRRRDQLREYAHTIASLRMRVDVQGSEIASLRTQVDVQGGEIASFRKQADAQGYDIASLSTHAAAQGGEIASLRDPLAGTREAPHAVAKQLRWEDVPHLEKQGLFIVGHARSGTSILLRALNTCPEIFLLGEASIFVEGSKRGFARWFNDMHGQVGQANGKGTYCPLVPDEGANGVETLNWLGERFRYVGEKMAFRSEKLGYNPRGYFDFHARHFLRSHYVCVVRNPVDLLKSNNHMFKPEDLSVYADSYLQSLQLTLELANTFPNVFVLFHERIDQQSFDTIGERLGVSLQDASSLYDKKLQADGRWRDDEVSLPSLDTLVEAHRQVRVVFSPHTLQKYPGAHWQELSRDMRALRQELAAKLAA